MGTTYWAITILLAAMVLWSAVAKLRRDPNVTRVVHEIVGVPLRYFPLLAACEIAGALGLVLGIQWPFIGAAATGPFARRRPGLSISDNRVY
jgi:hypothetical protein